MNLGKQIKSKIIEKLNKIVLPKMDFKCTPTRKYNQRFSGMVKMDKLKLYNPYPNIHQSDPLILIVDVTVSGYCVLRICYREEHEVTTMMNSSPSYISSYSSTSTISFTKNYNDKDKRKKMEMTSKIKDSIFEQIEENLKVMCIKNAISPIGHISQIKIGKIKYE